MLDVLDLEVHGNLKRDYQFVWKLYNIRDSHNNWAEDVKSYFYKFLPDDKFIQDDYDYISNLAQKVNLPKNDVNILSEYNYGEIDTEISYGRKYPDIQVSYLEDENESVYKFHYFWFTMCKNHDYPLYLFTAKASYISYGLTQDESTTYGQQMIDHYPSIYPKSISRTDANKSGNGFAGVTITYGQLINPKLNTTHSLEQPYKDVKLNRVH